LHLYGYRVTVWLMKQPPAPGQLAYRRAPAITLRWATEADADRLEILAELDEAPVPAAPLLLGFVADELWSAVSLSTGAAIADPFKPSADVTALALERGRQLTVATGGHSRFGISRRLAGAGVRLRAPRFLGHETI
jgi:hypothetical protein